MRQRRLGQRQGIYGFTYEGPSLVHNHNQL